MNITIIITLTVSFTLILGWNFIFKILSSFTPKIIERIKKKYNLWYVKITAINSIGNISHPFGITITNLDKRTLPPHKLVLRGIAKGHGTEGWSIGDNDTFGELLPEQSEESHFNNDILYNGIFCDSSTFTDGCYEKWIFEIKLINSDVILFSSEKFGKKIIESIRIYRAGEKITLDNWKSRCTRGTAIVVGDPVIDNLYHIPKWYHKILKII